MVNKIYQEIKARRQSLFPDSCSRKVVGGIYAIAGGELFSCRSISLTGVEMSKQQKRNKKKPLIITVTVIVGLALLTTGGIFGLKAYQKHQEDKIYSVGDTIHYPDFNLVVTKADVKPVNLPIKADLVKKYGGLDTPENCDTVSKAQKLEWYGAYKAPGISDYNICIRRNDSRQEIKKYSDANHQLVLDYKIVADDTVSTKDIKIRLIPDSGRNPTEQVNQFNGNEFMNDMYSEFDGAIMQSRDYVEYKPYFSSWIGENISKGITRPGYLYTDVRNSENSADFILTYTHNGKENIRTVRIDLTKK